MSYDWGPHYLVPTGVIKTYSGNVLLREEYDQARLYKELEELGLTGRVVRINNPWYYRKKNTDTWIQIGESQDEHKSFSVRWDTTNLENGQYEIMGLMHVFIEEENDGKGRAIARENIVEVTVKN
ncbi:MAG: hypothetical protein V1932_08610 [Chloroflexota bacterium]